MNHLVDSCEETVFSFEYRNIILIIYLTVSNDFVFPGESNGDSRPSTTVRTTALESTTVPPEKNENELDLTVSEVGDRNGPTSEGFLPIRVICTLCG